MFLRLYLQLFCKFFSWNFIIIIVPTTPKGNFFSERKKAKEGAKEQLLYDSIYIKLWNIKN